MWELGSHLKRPDKINLRSCRNNDKKNDRQETDPSKIIQNGDRESLTRDLEQSLSPTSLEYSHQNRLN